MPLQHATVLVPIAMFGFIPVVLGLFMVLSPRRAVLAGYVLGWLLLPMAGYVTHGLPDYNKVAATVLPVILGILIFDPRRLLTLRPRWFDVPVVIWCLSRLLSCWAGGLGLYAGLSGSLETTITWGLPYAVGRMYFNDEEGLYDLAMAIVLGGLLYVPLCLYEIRMSPQLHNILYGYHQHIFLQQIRDGGYRPMVFMQHGLAVALWMGIATVLAASLWCGGVRRVWRVPMVLAALALFAVTLMCKSVGPAALMLLALAVVTAVWMRLPRMRVVLLCVAMLAPAYLTARLGADWSGQGALEVAGEIVSPTRVKSLAFRLHNENDLLGRAMREPVFGWGRTDRFRGERVHKDDVLDSMWINTVGQTGLVGLVSYITMLLLPVVMLLWRVPRAMFYARVGAPAVGLAAALCMYALDKMVNGMFNPILILAAGGLLAFACMNRFEQVSLPDSRLCAAGARG